MNIFNSLGSNYDLRTALRILFSFSNKRAELIEYLEQRYGLPGQGSKVVLTYKGRDALTLALQALPQKGPIAFNGYTCLAVYESVARSGHEPLYVDISGDSLNFSAEALRNALRANPETKAVIVQNTLGFPCDITEMENICREHRIPLIEDLAHSIGAHYVDGREAGTVGDLVALTFSQDKVVDAVSGGALVVRNGRYRVGFPVERVSFAQQLKDHFYPLLTWKIRFAYLIGVGRPFHALLRSLGVLSSPFGKMYGPRALPNWYCANILREYLRLEKVAAHRKRIADMYARELAGVRVPQGKNGADLRFPILVEERDTLITHLREHGVHVSDVWYDAPIAPKKYLHNTTYRDECPGAERISALMLNLPTHINISPEDARHISRWVNLSISRRSGYEVRDVGEKTWEAFMQKERPHSFLHSWMWGAHAEATGSKVFRLGVFHDNELVTMGQFIKIVARRGSFLLCPHGPVIAKGTNNDVLAVLMRRASILARQEHCDFIRVCPLVENSSGNKKLYRELDFRDAPIHMHPELAWMLDITKPEEQLLSEMRKTTRYLIRKLEKPARTTDAVQSGGEGVQIETSTDPDDIEKFWPVYQATVERQQFTPFKKSDLRKEFELFAKSDNAAFFFGKQNDQIVATAIIIFYNDQAFYHHSGSTSAGSNVSYLLQWRVIQEAKRRGCTLYNFWGISPTDRPRHPWAGLSLFKKGFGGFAEEYLHAQDKPLTTKYWLNCVVETARRIRRGF